jgi:predicted small metal-binding protein
MKRLACGDIMEGCDAVFEGDSEEEVLAQGAEHAREVHGIEELTPEIAAKVSAAVQDV